MPTQPPPSPFFPWSLCVILTGSGNPNGLVVTLPGTLFYDSLNNTFYRTADGIVWVPVVSGSGGGGGNPPAGVVDPNGNVSGAPGATYFNTNNSTFWQQTSAVTANTGWVQLI